MDTSLHKSIPGIAMEVELIIFLNWIADENFKDATIIPLVLFEAWLSLIMLFYILCHFCHTDHNSYWQCNIWHLPVNSF